MASNNMNQSTQFARANPNEMSCDPVKDEPAAPEVGLMDNGPGGVACAPATVGSIDHGDHRDETPRTHVAPAWGAVFPARVAGSGHAAERGRSRPSRRDRVGSARPSHWPHRHPPHRRGALAGRARRPPAGRAQLRARPDQPLVEGERDLPARRLRRPMRADRRPARMGLRGVRRSAHGRTSAVERPGWTLWDDGVPGGETAAAKSGRAWTESSPAHSRPTEMCCCSPMGIS